MVSAYLGLLSKQYHLFEWKPRIFDDKSSVWMAVGAYLLLRPLRSLDQTSKHADRNPNARGDLCQPLPVKDIPHSEVFSGSVSSAMSCHQDIFPRSVCESRKVACRTLKIVMKGQVTATKAVVLSKHAYVVLERPAIHEWNK